MNHDLLKAATRALREETERPDQDGSETRARLMASLHQTRVRKRTRLAFALPLAASFVAATALGRLDQRIPQLVRSVAHSLGWSANTGDTAPPPSPRKNVGSTGSKLSPTRTTPTRNLAPVESVVPPTEPVATPLDAPTSPQAPEIPPSASSGAAPRAGGNPPPQLPAPRASATEQDAGLTRELDLYRTAHRAHFEQHDYVRALQGWDRYLRLMPNGRFAPEARYNRGVCLLRLGREAEAQQALAPFASGQYGEYRRSEAQAVIEALQR
ncbi:MAG TPA: hypothetical protein VFQ61_20500 [Polyangiaceae bacterium]|nr:hypothetical protein [Polyangiaceae bacterium]